jgi:hypothetical protein
VNNQGGISLSNYEAYIIGGERGMRLNWNVFAYYTKKGKKLRISSYVTGFFKLRNIPLK